MIYAIFTGILVIFANLLTLFLAKRWAEKWFNRQKSAVLEQISATAHAYFDSPSENELSPFALAIDEIAKVFSRRLMQSARAQLQNMASIDSRQLSAEEADGATAGNPIAEMLPVSKKTKKNPLYQLGVNWLASKFIPNMGGPGPAPAPAPSNGADPFRL